MYFSCTFDSGRIKIQQISTRAMYFLFPAGRPADPVPAAPAEAQREGFMSRLFGGWGSGPETPPEHATAVPADGAAPAASDGQGEGKRKGFFTRLMDGATLLKCSEFGHAIVRHMD